MAVPSIGLTLGIFRQYVAAMVAAISMLMVGMSNAWPSPVLPKILSNTAPLEMDTTQISWMVSILLLGNSLSPFPMGWLMDMFGRKRIMCIMNIFPFSAWIITYFGRSPWELYVARFFNGLWAGASYTICAVYIGEIAEPSIRGSLSNFNNLWKTGGGLLVFAVGPYISYESLAILCGLVPVLFFVCSLFIPESPYYLLMKNRREDAKDALRWLRGNKKEFALEQELLKIEKSLTDQTQMKGSFKDVFTDQANRKAFFITMIVSIVKNQSGYDVMVAYTSITLPKKAFEVLGPNECVIILGVVSIVTCVVSTFIIDRYPRRFFLIFSTVGCAITTLVAGCWFYLHETTDVQVEDFAQIPFYCFVVHAVVYSVGLGPIVASIKGEMFSANIKALCASFTSVTFAVLGFLSAKVYLIIATSVGMYMNYFIFGVSCAVGAVFIAVYVVETRGKSLHEIQQILSKKKKTVEISVIT